MFNQSVNLCFKDLSFLYGKNFKILLSFELCNLQLLLTAIIIPWKLHNLLLFSLYWSFHLSLKGAFISTHNQYTVVVAVTVLFLEL